MTAPPLDLPPIEAYANRAPVRLGRPRHCEHDGCTAPQEHEVCAVYWRAHHMDRGVHYRRRFCAEHRAEVIEDLSKSPAVLTVSSRPLGWGKLKGE